MSVGIAALGQSYFATAEDVLYGATSTTKMTGELVCAEPTVLITGCWQKVVEYFYLELEQCFWSFPHVSVFHYSLWNSPLQAPALLS